jgi:5-methylcytosine-specific restriction endonuclease McrA
MMTLRLPPEEYALLVKQVLSRDSYKCRSCGFRAGLGCHHVVYRSHQGEDTAENLVTLCASCHRGCHEEQGIDIIGVDANKELRFLRKNGWQPQ